MAGPERGQRKDKLIRDALRLAALRVVEGDPKGRQALTDRRREGGRGCG